MPGNEAMPAESCKLVLQAEPSCIFTDFQQEAQEEELLLLPPEIKILLAHKINHK